MYVSVTRTYRGAGEFSRNKLHLTVLSPTSRLTCSANLKNGRTKLIIELKSDPYKNGIELKKNETNLNLIQKQ